VWGIVAGLIAGLVIAPGLRRFPAREHVHGAPLAEQFLWEGVAYGIAEAVLLATLPVLALWQAAAALGWTEGTWVKFAAGRSRPSGPSSGSRSITSATGS